MQAAVRKVLDCASLREQRPPNRRRRSARPAYHAVRRATFRTFGLGAFRDEHQAARTLALAGRAGGRSADPPSVGSGSRPPSLERRRLSAPRPHAHGAAGRASAGHRRFHCRRAWTDRARHSAGQTQRGLRAAGTPADGYRVAAGGNQFGRLKRTARVSPPAPRPALRPAPGRPGGRSSSPGKGRCRSRAG